MKCERPRERESRQKYRQISRHRQMDRKTEGDMRRRIFERERVLNLVLLLLPPMPVLHNDTALAI